MAAPHGQEGRLRDVQIGGTGVGGSGTDTATGGGNEQLHKCMFDTDSERAGVGIRLLPRDIPKYLLYLVPETKPPALRSSFNTSNTGFTKNASRSTSSSQNPLGYMQHL